MSLSTEGLTRSLERELQCIRDIDKAQESCSKAYAVALAKVEKELKTLREGLMALDSDTNGMDAISTVHTRLKQQKIHPEMLSKTLSLHKNVTKLDKVNNLNGKDGHGHY